MSPVSAQPRAAGSAARECSPASVVQLPLPPEMTVAVWFWLSAISWPPGAAASASASPARPDSGGQRGPAPAHVGGAGDGGEAEVQAGPHPGDQRLPGRGGPATTIAPLVAMSGGVAATSGCCPRAAGTAARTRSRPTPRPSARSPRSAPAASADISRQRRGPRRLRDCRRVAGYVPHPAASAAGSQRGQPAPRHPPPGCQSASTCRRPVMSCAGSGSLRRPVRSRTTTRSRPCPGRGRCPAPRVARPWCR